MSKKRERRSPAEWQKLISEQQASGLTMDKFARERGIAAASLYFWKKRLKGDSLQVSTSRRPKGVFTEVVVVPRASSAASRIEVVTRHGRTIRIEGIVDVAMLRDVLRVVESC